MKKKIYFIFTALSIVYANAFSENDGILSCPKVEDIKINADGTWKGPFTLTLNGKSFSFEVKTKNQALAHPKGFTGTNIASPDPDPQVVIECRYATLEGKIALLSTDGYSESMGIEGNCHYIEQGGFGLCQSTNIAKCRIACTFLKS